ncbi:UDP-2,3-diacylglucosamine diphosphatase [Zooshikella marina]|uniref:UDP-2,3-diacylglucosamine diphosphatase n=1 Tax=Zooshikella ganghwensis TaxID=202772 RepID=UPI001BAF917D|nr:UDP-2,3-diacylglucosamine diphosphatase [Zooshikella ganghwensis]MBU2705385.1 UDP-2,3-diacylglucosamine diphosphatase [Zooshikella ganghwensis]
MSVLFISDLHLQAKRPDLTAALAQFLIEQAPQAESLYILGDLFDAWLGDDAMDDLQQTVASQIRQLINSGTAVYFMHGNRDFLIGEDFAAQTGVQLLKDPCVITLGDQPVLLSHGDQLCTADKDYMAFRHYIRNPATIQKLLSLSVAERIAMAENIRNQSQAANQAKTDEIMDVTPAEVEKLMTEHDVKCFIHGHTHRPAIHTLTINQQPAQRIVLGDWDKKGWMLHWDESAGFSLTEFPL